MLRGSQNGIVMYEPSVSLPDELFEALVARLGLAGVALSPSLAVLHLLVASFTDNIAYDNIGIVLGEAVPSTVENDAVERCAVQYRGGYCFVLVPAFAALLSRVGSPAPISARHYRNYRQSLSPV